MLLLSLSLFFSSVNCTTDAANIDVLWPVNIFLISLRMFHYSGYHDCFRILLSCSSRIIKELLCYFFEYYRRMTSMSSVGNYSIRRKPITSQFASLYHTLENQFIISSQVETTVEGQFSLTLCDGEFECHWLQRIEYFACHS